MADIKFVVEVDSAKGTAAIRELDGAVDKLTDTGKKSGSTFKETFAGMLSGMAVYDTLKKVGREALGFVKDSVGAAAEAEAAQKALKLALETTGREVDANAAHFFEYSGELQKLTVYEDDQIKKAQALLIQLTTLDRDGLDSATRGAIGLASVLGMDLNSASQLIAKAMEGNYAALSRYGIKVRETGTDEEKRADLLAKLEVFYKRAEGETETFSGTLKQMGNIWGDVKEEVGFAITENETFQAILKKVKDELVGLIESGKIREWAETGVKGVQLLIRGVEELMDLLPHLDKGLLGLAEHTVDNLLGIEDALDELEREGRQKVREFQKTLEVLRPTTEELRKEIEKGPEAWKEYTDRMTALDRTLRDNKSTIEGWFGAAAKFLAVNKEAPPVVDRHRASLEGLRKEAKGLGVTLRSDLVSQLGNMEKNLRSLAGAGQLTPAAIKKIKDEIIALRKELGLSIPEHKKTKAAIEEVLRVKGSWIKTTSGVQVGLKELQAAEEESQKEHSKYACEFIRAEDQIAEAWSRAYEQTIRPSYEDWGELLKEHYGYIQDYCLGMDQAFDGMKTSLGDTFVEIGLGHKGFLEGMGDVLEGFANSAGATMRKFMVDLAMETVRTWVLKQTQALASVIASVMKGIPFPANLIYIGGAIAAVTALFSKIKAFEEGGIVTRPTMGLVGEAGPEAIIPLNRTTINNYLGGANDMRRDQPIHIHVNVGSERLADAVVRITEEQSALGRMKIHARAVVQ